MQSAVLPIFLFAACVISLAAVLLLANLFNPRRPGCVKRMPYESGMDPIHDVRRRFDVRFHLVAIAFLVFDVELLFLYPWAVTARPAKLADSPVAQTATAETVHPPPTPRMNQTVIALQGTELVKNRNMVFPGVMVFIALLALGFIYHWRKGIFRWR